jgi:hypothetical protein
MKRDQAIGGIRDGAMRAVLGKDGKWRANDARLQAILDAQFTGAHPSLGFSPLHSQLHAAAAKLGFTAEEFEPPQEPPQPENDVTY